MKKVLAVAIMVMLISGLAYGESTGRGVYTTPAPGLTNWLNTNDYFLHNHDYEQLDRKSPVGLGLDVTVYEFEGSAAEWGLDSIEVQQKYDMRNEEYSLYGVCQLNLWKVIKRFGK